MVWGRAVNPSGSAVARLVGFPVVGAELWRLKWSECGRQMERQVDGEWGQTEQQGAVSLAWIWAKERHA